MKKYTPFIVLFLVFLIAFSPIISFVFALKNDMFLGYFPPRYLLGEVLFSKQMPIWNPYISFGLPFYGDMNGSYWSPITWFIALTTGYNAYTLTLEVIFYLFFGAVGMYFLSKHFTTNRFIELIAALAYLCNGYNIGHLQHLNWISGASFLPWCIWGFLRLNNEFRVKDLFITTIFSYLLISSSHPGIIISSFYFLLLIFLYYIINSIRHYPLTYTYRIVKINFFLISLLGIVSVGIIFGYTDILPYFSRNIKLSPVAANTAPTTFQSLLSFILPFATTKNESFFGTDISMRNCYFSITLFIFFLNSLISKKTGWQYFFFLTALFFGLLSSNSVIKDFAFKSLPLIGYIRLSGEFRLFSIFSLIVISVIELNKMFSNSQFSLLKIQFIIISLIIGLILTFFFTFYQIQFSHDSILFNTTLIEFNKSYNIYLKEIVDFLSFPDTILLQCLIQIFLLSILLYILRIRNIKLLLVLIITDVISSTLLNLPYTGIGKTPVFEIYSIHKRTGRGIPIPKLQPIFKNDILIKKDSILIGDWSFYNRQIGTSKRIIYPVFLKNTLAYYDAIEKDSLQNLKAYPFIFIASKVDSINILKDSTQELDKNDILLYTTNQIHVRFNSTNNGYLVLQQNYYPHWFYKKGDTYFHVEKAGYNFFCVPIKKGKNDIEIIFSPPLFYLFFYITLTTFIIFCLAALIINRKRRMIFTQFK